MTPRRSPPRAAPGSCAAQTASWCRRRRPGFRPSTLPWRASTRFRGRCGGSWSPSRLPEQAYPLPNLLVMVAIWAVEQRLAPAQRQIAAADEAVVQQAVRPLLQGITEIDEDVRADDQVKVVERTVADQVVAGPRDARLKRSVEARAPAGDCVVVRQRALPAGRLVGLLVLAHTLERIGPHPRHGDQVLVQVGGVDVAPIEDAFLFEQDGKPVDLLAGRAPGHPHARRGVRAEKRPDLLADSAHELGVAEHARDLHADIAEEPLHALRVVQ